MIWLAFAKLLGDLGQKEDAALAKMSTFCYGEDEFICYAEAIAKRNP